MGAEDCLLGAYGCCTGNYLLVAGDYSSSDILPLVKDTMAFIASYEGRYPVRAHATAATGPSWIPTEPVMLLRRYLVEVLEHPAYDNLNYPS